MQPARHIRSFVRRGRLKEAQKTAKPLLWEQFGLSLSVEKLNFNQIFGREAPCLVEIGFGVGQSFLAAATQYPDKNFIGIETHRPGIMRMLQAIDRLGLQNIRLYEADSVDVFNQAFNENSLAGIQIFFPDPWPKRRHHRRRLLQVAFLQQLAVVLQIGGTVHLATDWEDYAHEMLSALSQVNQLCNLSGMEQFSEQRSPYRPIMTKFEQRALQEGRQIYELHLVRVG